MPKELNFDTFLDTYDGIFSEYLGKISYPTKEEKRYADLKQRILDIYNRYPSIADIVDMGIPRSLTLEESKALIELLAIRSSIIDLENRQIYFKGCADCIGYLKKIGTI